ncbi:hypothetical protein [Cognatilysobacter bugurensis]|uniref:Uncharacterized protein n=1 Tax=Cognatilysobacter bugurensis TaxID=543356 RepID=A0A918W6V5_9GAMM|nr:hypothetical protein [Lysobacter bugurensis]GHA75026.1 hypothetical protein GCM10007067_10150 [Lysobacter bugurensis]
MSYLKRLSEMAPDGDTQHHWDRLVGRFVLAFGDIENVVTSCLRLLPQDPIGRTASELHLAQRISLLEEILSPRRTAARSNLLDAVKAVRRYSSKRNIVAHNGLSFRFERDGQGLAVESAIRSTRGDRFHEVSHREMIDLVEEVMSISAALNNAFLEVVDDEPEIEHRLDSE